MGGNAARFANFGSARGLGITSFGIGGPLACLTRSAVTQGPRPVTSPRAICLQLLDEWMLRVR
jgi:hypothetical protein